MAVVFATDQARGPVVLNLLLVDHIITNWDRPRLAAIDWLTRRNDTLIAA